MSDVDVSNTRARALSRGCNGRVTQECERNSMGEHRAAAEHALTNAQHNPVMSAEESFKVAQVHALLAIEQRLEELVARLCPGELLSEAP